MALNDITFIKNANGLGRRIQSADGVSGMVFYSAALPTGFSATDRIKVVYSLAEAESLGVTKAAFAGINYQVKEFFRANPNGKLYVSINAVPATTYDFIEVKTLVNFSDGEVKLVGVWANALPFATAQVATLNAIGDSLYTAFKPVSIFYGAEYSTFTVATIPTALSSAPYVTVVVAEDGTPGSDGKALRTSTSKSVAAVGLSVGTVSKAKVSESIGWLKKFNLSDGVNMEVPAVGTGSGDAVNSLTETQLDGLKTKGFLATRKYSGIAGSYFVDSLTSDVATSDFSAIENVRTIHKAIGAVRTTLLPELMSPLKLSVGKLSEDTVAKFELAAKQALESMEFAGELSSFSIAINPEQNVLSTSKIEISLSLVPLGVARQILVNIGFATK